MEAGVVKNVHKNTAKCFSNYC